MSYSSPPFPQPNGTRSMLARILTFLVLAPILALAQDAQQSQLRDDAWKGGAPVPPAAIAVVAGIAAPTDPFVDEMAARGVRADNAVGRETLSSLVAQILVADGAMKRQVTSSESGLD